jgi:hypothetical protein
MKMKFVTFSDYHGEQIIVFPDHIQHAQFARGVQGAAFSDMRPIAGGFVVDGECVGKSISLRLESRSEDTELLKTLMGNRINTTPAIDYVFQSVSREPVVKPSSLTKNQRKRLNKKIN